MKPLDETIKGLEALRIDLDAESELWLNSSGAQLRFKRQVATLDAALSHLRSLAPSARLPTGAQLCARLEAAIHAIEVAGTKSADVAKYVEPFVPEIRKAIAAISQSASMEERRTEYAMLHSIRDFVVERQKGAGFQAVQDAWDEVGKLVNAKIGELIREASSRNMNKERP